MAIASVGSLGSLGQTTNNQAGITIVTSATLEVGNVGILLVAVDNAQTTDGDSTAISSVQDSAGNAWVKAKEFTNGQGTAQTGATCSVWYTVATAQLNSGSNLNASFANAGTSDASAASAWEFTVAAGSKIGIEGTPGGLANDAAAQGSLNVTTANIECLRIRAIASESSSTTVLTKTAAFAALFSQAVSGAGTSDTEMGIRGEWLISTSTGQASAPTGGAGAVDHASVYVAFKELVLQTLTPGLYTNSQTFPAAAVSHGLTAGLFTNSQTFPAVTVEREAIPTWGSSWAASWGDSWGPVEVTSAQGLAPALYTNSQTFPAATVTVGAVTLTPTLYTDPDTFHAATIGVGAVSLAPTLFTDADTFFLPIVQQEGGPQFLVPPLYTDPDTFFPPIIQVEGEVTPPEHRPVGPAPRIRIRRIRIEREEEREKEREAEERARERAETLKQRKRRRAVIAAIDVAAEALAEAQMVVEAPPVEGLVRLLGSLGDIRAREREIEERAIRARAEARDLMVALHQQRQLAIRAIRVRENEDEAVAMLLLAL